MQCFICRLLIIRIVYCFICKVLQAVGPLLAGVLAFFFITLMMYLAGCLIWTIIFACQLFMLAITLCCFYMGGPPLPPLTCPYQRVLYCALRLTVGLPLCEHIYFKLSCMGL